MIKNHDNPLRPTNSPKTNYIISDEALETIKKYNTSAWGDALKKFKSKRSCLIELYGNNIDKNKLNLDIDDININFSQEIIINFK